MSELSQEAFQRKEKKKFPFFISVFLCASWMGGGLEELFCAYRIIFFCPQGSLIDFPWHDNLVIQKQLWASMACRTNSSRSMTLIALFVLLFTIERKPFASLQFYSELLGSKSGDFLFLFPLFKGCYLLEVGWQFAIQSCWRDRCNTKDATTMMGNYLFLKYSPIVAFHFPMNGQLMPVLQSLCRLFIVLDRR